MILVKTETGHQVFKDRSVRLSPRQRSAFILFDGNRSVDDVLAAGMGIESGDLDRLVELGLLGPADEASPVPPDASPDAAMPPPSAADAPLTGALSGPEPVKASTEFAKERSPQQLYQDAYPIATRLTSGLGLRGFRLNLSVEGTSGYHDLVALAPKIRAAVGLEKAAELDRALALL